MRTLVIKHKIYFAPYYNIRKHHSRMFILVNGFLYITYVPSHSNAAGIKAGKLSPNKHAERVVWRHMSTVN